MHPRKFTPDDQLASDLSRYEERIHIPDAEWERLEDEEYGRIQAAKNFVDDLDPDNKVDPLPDYDFCGE